jgi:hypothetical protein
VLVDPFDINTRGEIVGFAVDPSTPDEGHAFLAVPCDQEHANRKGCTGEGIAVSAGESSEVPRVSLSANVRKLLQQHAGIRYHVPGLRAPKN